MKFLILLLLTVVVVADFQQQINDLQTQLDEMNRRLQTDGGMTGGMAGSMGGDDGMDHSGHGGDAAANGDETDHGSHGSTSVGHGLFFTTGDDTIILFEGWQTSNYGEYIGSCLFVIGLGIFLEWLSMVRECYGKKKSDGGFSSMNTPTSSNSDGDNIRLHVVKTVMYMVSVTLAYALMLIIMNFNVGLFISAILGLSIGYFIFGRRRSQCGSDKSTECCHDIA